MEPEFRRGTPTKAEHEAHAYEINGERRSTWLVKGFLFIAITDGENWWIKPTEPNQGEGWFWVAMPWWPSGEEEWCPCKQGRPIAWAPSRRPEHAVALRAEGDAEVRAWSCGTCGAVYGAAQRHLAAICHGPHQCEWHAGCDAETPKNRLYCAKHDVEHEAEKRRQAFEAAEKVDGSDYRGWVFWDADPEGDGFHASLAELAAHCRYFHAYPVKTPKSARRTRHKPGQSDRSVSEPDDLTRRVSTRTVALALATVGATSARGSFAQRALRVSVVRHARCQQRPAARHYRETVSRTAPRHGGA